MRHGNCSKCFTACDDLYYQISASGPVLCPKCFAAHEKRERRLAERAADKHYAQVAKDWAASLGLDR